MNGGQIAFYASVATAIPVVLAIYITGARDWAKKGATWYVGNASIAVTRFFNWAVRPLWRNVPPRVSDTPTQPRFRRLTMQLLFLVPFTLAAGVFVVLLAALLALVASPLVGEAAALHALSSNRATSAAETWATIGLVATGLPVFGPLTLGIIRPLRRAVLLLLGPWLTVSKALFRRQVSPSEPPPEPDSTEQTP